MAAPVRLRRSAETAAPPAPPRAEPIIAPVLPPICLPRAVPATLPKAEVAAIRVELSAWALTAIIDDAANVALNNNAFSFIVNSMSKKRTF